MRVLAEISDEGHPHYAIDTIKLTFCNDENNLKKVKYVSLEDFAELVGAGLDRKGTCVLGEMPTGYYNASIGVESKGFACEAILILPKKVQRITYMNTTYNMELPSLVFAFQIEGGRMKKTHVFCMKKEQPTSKSMLYHFPLGNVASQDGSVCWGANQLPDVKCLKDLDVIMTYFISSPFNSDHYRRNENNKMKDFELRDLCVYVEKEGKFDEEQILMPMTSSGYRTLGELQKTMHL